MSKRSKAYWVKRATALEQSIQNGTAVTTEGIIGEYRRAVDSINGDIARVFKQFSKASGITEAKARELITKAESDKLYADLLKLYKETRDTKLRSEIAARINAQAYGARISRLEALKQNIYIHAKRAYNYDIKAQEKLYRETAAKAYYGTIYNTAEGFNCGIDFSVLPQKAIDEMLAKPWLGVNYSSRVWHNNERFINSVQQTVEDGITAGHSVSRMAEKLQEFVRPNHGQSYVTERLVRTETAHFMAEGQLKAYEEMGAKKYQYIAALSERTCDICGNLDGEEFDVSEARAGDNYPPMHANCRCTTIIAGFTPKTRIARDPLTGENYKVDGGMSFNEWKKSLSDEQKAAMKYVDNFGGSGIINYARASDIFLYEKDNIPSSAQILPEDIIKNLEISSIGRETIKYIEDNNVAVYLNYERQIHFNRGFQEGNIVNVFMSNILNETVAAQTVIHEVTHARYNIGKCQWAEAVCFAQEKKHITGRNELTFSEKRYIVELAKKNYPEYEWKKGGYSGGKYF